MRNAFAKLKQLDLLDLAFLTFLVFIFCIPFQKRLEFSTDLIIFLEFFNEYVGSYVYGTDILALFIVLLVSAHHLLHRKDRNVAQGGLSRSWLPLSIGVFLVSLAPSVIQTYNENHAGITFYLHLLLFAFLAFSIPLLLKRISSVYLVLLALMLSGAYQSLIGIIQFAQQGSLGLTVLGESQLSANTLNVAKIVVDGIRMIRVYGTFPHPNIFAAFLAVSIPATMILIFTLRKKILRSVSKTTLMLMFLIVQYAALVLTFSRTGWIAAVVTILPLAAYFAWYIETQEQDTALRVKFCWFIAILTISVLTIIVSSLPLIRSRAQISDFQGDMAVSHRTLLLEVSRETLQQHPIVGRGVRSFTLALHEFGPDNLQNWQYQPVHNIYWLIASESGILGLLGFFVLILGIVLSLVKSRKNKVRQQRILLAYFFLSFLAFLLIGLLDHHPYDIQQSQLIFWLQIGLILAVLRMRNSE